MWYVCVKSHLNIFSNPHTHKHTCTGMQATLWCSHCYCTLLLLFIINTTYFLFPTYVNKCVRMYIWISGFQSIYIHDMFWKNQIRELIYNQATFVALRQLSLVGITVLCSSIQNINSLQTPTIHKPIKSYITIRDLTGENCR